ncbi:MAG: HDOD domain-containing protein [Gammaproteobacteria bacterium]|nr:HDOD domain-containing protein [Gammaproteobacteria bacterium]MBU1601657.1 HDOD domain-containing protein [Gammaproteobacteria bacterium]MBU2434736.1 HDOD domain-containing protein [Gammaproteobacteria bacterium]MBU2447977.1 HDOD domain-containing protein [Gammaproteobacteria bacterium]
MFNSLKKLFGGKPGKTGGSLPASTAPANTAATQFLRREAVFDRNNRLSGHVFRLQESTPLADADDQVQRSLDETLLDTLNTSSDAWNTSLAFIPLNSASLDLAAVDRLKSSNIVLLVQLAADAEADIVCAAIDRLHERGLLIGVFRQPKNPAFAKVIQQADFAAIDIAAHEADTARDFSAAVRASAGDRPKKLLACNVETIDDLRFCQQWHFDNFHGKFASSESGVRSESSGDPHKALLLNIVRLVQGDAETAEIAEAMKQDPLLSFRILRYLNSPALGLSHRIDSLAQALLILGRQRLTRWLSVLLFSVREPHFGDWLLVENALTRGRLMEALGEQSMPGVAHDPLFLTGIFSCLGELLHRPLAETLNDMLLADDIKQALLEHSGPYAPLLAVAEASEEFDLPRMRETALAAGVAPETVNRALLAATAWASEVTEYWE